MTDSVPLATGDIEVIGNLHECPNSMLVTCPEREGGCVYTFGPDRPDDYELSTLINYPYCSSCDCSLVIISRADYDGPTHKFRTLEEPGETRI